jgi:glycerophosphoryl diester phosphodiesterase
LVLRLKLMQSSLFAHFDRLIAPPPEAQRVAFLSAQPYAHRGLHSGIILENSRAAFAAAITANHGIELDVQAAREGEAFVFHDPVLDRLTDSSGPFGLHSAHQLDRVKLKGTNETIPRLVEILALVRGRVPILIEIKSNEAAVGVLCLGVRRALEGYTGNVAIMSFNPAVGRWFRNHAPRFVRGLVVTEQGNASTFDRIKSEVLRRFALWTAKPDFLAYDIRDLPSVFASGQHNRGLKLLTWTVRTAQQERTAFAYADEIIYEKPVAMAG